MAQSKKTSEKSDQLMKKMVKAMWLLALAFVGLFALIFIIVSFSKLPDTAELENPKFEISTVLYTDEGEKLGSYFKKNRTWVTYEELSPHAVNALISTEDERFYAHSGIDSRATLRAVAYLGSKGGASTITQQLAKLFFTKRSSNFVKRVWQKMQEWVIAIEFEKRYTKQEILAMYLNKYDFLHGANGISAAANTYFGKNQKDLNVEEAASLIGMLKNPLSYNPKSRPEKALKRREVVLSQMLKKGYFEQSEYDSLRILPLDLSHFDREAHDKGLAPHFREELKKWLKELLNDPKNSKPGGGKYDMYKDGLKIHTTLNLRMQQHAEESAKNHMKSVQKKYFEVWKNLDPWTYDANESQKKQRRDALTNHIHDSDRYKRLRSSTLGGISQKIAQNINSVRLWDADIHRMLNEKKNSGYLVKLEKKDYISKKQQNTYYEIMQSEYWSELVNQWNRLQRKAKADFNKKVKMKVFAYNAAGEKELFMSPLDSIKYHLEHMQLGSMSIDPKTGYIKTWVGGVGFKYFKYDHVNSERLVGSTFKPFVYLTAIMQGMSPCWKLVDHQYVITAGDPDFGLTDDWAPKNARDVFTNRKFTLYECLKNSLNSASIALMKQIGGVQPVIDRAVSMGIPREKIPKYPSICLGTPELSVMDLTPAYATFANNGLYTQPVFVSRIEDADGKIIWKAPEKRRRALGEDENYVMIDMLKYAASSRHFALDSEFGGKTGTTNNHVDGWFMGITPNLVTGTWVGGNFQWIRFLTLENGQGGRMARPFFIDFMQKIERDPELDFDTDAVFYRPEGELDIEINCEIYEQLYQKNEHSDEQFDEEF